MCDGELLKLIRSDPEQGMSTLISLYAGLVYAVVKGRLSSSAFCDADIEDCVARSFSEFYCDLDKYDLSSGSIKAWLCTVARNNSLDLLRKHENKSHILSLNEDATAEYPDTFSLEGDFEDKALRAELIRAIKALGEPDREIIVRKFFLSQSSKEIATLLKMSTSNVDTRTHRAIHKLRKHFGGDLS